MSPVPNSVSSNTCISPAFFKRRDSIGKQAQQVNLEPGSLNGKGRSSSGSFLTDVSAKNNDNNNTVEYKNNEVLKINEDDHNRREIRRDSLEDETEDGKLCVNVIMSDGGTNRSKDGDKSSCLGWLEPSVQQADLTVPNEVFATELMECSKNNAGASPNYPGMCCFVCAKGSVCSCVCSK